MATLLLVEDTHDLAEVISRELEGTGYRVLHAAEGATALALMAQNRFDAVILDWMLPGLDGLEVLRRLRTTSAVPVLMLTARSEEADRVLGLEVGADDYLTKPFSMRELVAGVRALLRRAERIQQMLDADRNGDQENAPLHYSDLSLDPEGYQVWLGDESLDLSRTEVALLHLFLRNQGRAFSRAYLLDTIWGESYVGGDRSVDNTILRLRKKLGHLSDNIETVWGVGYRLKPETVP